MLKFDDQELSPFAAKGEFQSRIADSASRMVCGSLNSGLGHHVKMYASNERRYLQPAAACTHGPALEYILQLLDPTADVRPLFMDANSPQDGRGSSAVPPHLAAVAKKVEAAGGGSGLLLRSPVYQRCR